MQAPLNHFTAPKYWKFYSELPAKVRKVADSYFSLLTQNPKHPSLHLKKIGDLWSVRAGIHYRALGMETDEKSKGILPNRSFLAQGRSSPTRSAGRDKK